MTMATLLLVAIFITNQSLLLLNNIALGNLPATELLHLIVLQIPLLIGYLLPLGLYLSVLLTLSRMYFDSEMTILFVCGMSRVKITAMLLIIAFFIAAVVAYLMGSLVPMAQGETNTVYKKVAASASLGQVIADRFMMFGNQKNNRIVFYAGKVQNHAIMHDVFFAEKMNETNHLGQQAWSVIVAKSAFEKKISDGANKYLVFNQGDRYLGVPGEKNYRVLKFDQYGVQIKVNKIKQPIDEQYYSFSKLWSLSPKSLQSAGELQWRLAMPISALIFTFLAVPLSEVRSRSGKFTQLFPAILIYFIYANFIYSARAWIQSGHFSVWGMWWGHGAIILLAVILMTRQTIGHVLFKGCR